MELRDLNRDRETNHSNTLILGPNDVPLRKIKTHLKNNNNLILAIIVFSSGTNTLYGFENRRKPNLGRYVTRKTAAESGAKPAGGARATSMVSKITPPTKVTQFGK